MEELSKNLGGGVDRTYELLYALVSALGKRQICAYLVNMAVRLVKCIEF